MSKKSIILGLIILGVAILGYFLIAILVFVDMESRGQFGDMFGGINALFSGIALGGIVYTIFLQKQELGLQREELKLTRDELKRTAEAQEKSERALSKQAESLKITAKLNGKSAILQHYNTLIEMTNSAKYGIDEAKFNKLKVEADRILDDIERTINGK